MKKRLSSGLLALCMMLTLLPVSAFAEDGTIIASGECGAKGDNVTWTLDSEGTLTISGEGIMRSYYYGYDYIFNQPWAEYRSDIKKIVIEDGVTNISDDIFNGCVNLRAIEIPSSVTDLGALAFKDCSNLTDVVLPDNLTSIGEAAFSGCSSLSSITIPSSVTYIGSSAFFHCSNLTDVTLPENLSSIEQWTFWECTSLSEITVPKGVAYIGEDAFGGCKNLTKITLSNGLTSIRDNAFEDCESLTSITIPSSVTSIGRWAFGGCTSLSDIVFLGYTSRLVEFTFVDCTSLTSVILPEGVTYIEYGAFWRCISLKRVTIPESVTRIEYGAFMQSVYLNDVYFCGTRSQWHNIFTYNPDESEDYKTGYPFLSTAKIHCIDDPTVTYDANGGDGTMESIQLTMSDVYTFPACGFTAPAGKVFKAWSIGGTEYAPGATCDITVDTTVTAIWEGPDTPPEIPETPEKYTVSYHANGGSGTMDSVLVEKGQSYTLPACGFTAPAGKGFKAWQIDDVEYDPNDVYTVTRDTAVTAVWQTIPTVEYTLTGTITGHKGVIYTSVTAQLVGLNGSTYSAEVGAGVVDKTGKTEYAYTVSAPAGQYNLEVEARTNEGGVVNRTAVVKLTGNGQTKDVNLPNGQAKVKVENETGTAAFVGGLDELIIDADGEVNGEVTLKIGGVENSDPGVLAIRNAAPGQTLEFMELSISKTVDGTTTEVTDTGDVTIEIVLAFDRTGKSNITVYRYHSGSVDTLTAQESSNGEKIEVDDESIAIYAKKFSVYAIGYTVAATGPNIPDSPDYSGGSGGDSSSSNYGITVPTHITGGTVKVTPTSASEGQRVTITVKPNAGYELATLTVTDGKGNILTVTDQGDGKYTFTMPKSKVSIDVSFKAIGSATQINFTDVQSSAYYYDAVVWAVENGVTFGITDTAFGPDTACTRAQIVSFLWRQAGSPKMSGTNPFTDVSSTDYYYDAVLWAVENGITFGSTDTTFSPGTTCTRAQAMTFLYRGKKSPAVSGTGGFTDVSTDAYYTDAVQWAVANGVTYGTTATTFSPDQDCTRAQIVTFIYNAREK